MKLLLTSDVKKLGYLGDVVEVADGYARNYLLPQGLAKEATATNIKGISQEKANRAEHRRVERERLEKAAAAVEGAEAVIASTANEQGHLFGAVHARDIAQNLRNQGFEVADEVVELHEHIKQVGSHKVKLFFAEGLTATVNVVVVPEGDQPSSSPNPETTETAEDGSAGRAEES
jgi:large subunit ribosomal protein L9